MFSDSDSIREGFKYPSEDQEIPYYESGSRRNQVKDSNSGKFILPKDRFYFKLKVIKNVGQLVANLKSSIALSHHGLKEQEVQYLEGANNCLVE
jgi:hypothetical protein